MIILKGLKKSIEREIQEGMFRNRSNKGCLIFWIIWILKSWRRKSRVRKSNKKREGRGKRGMMSLGREG